jgi:hypothetical protein
MGASELGVGTGGVWTTADARRRGLTVEQVRHRTASGEWQRLRRGVFTDGGIVADAGMRAWAAVVAAGGSGRAWATGRTTARLLDLPLIDDDDPATGALDRAHDDVAVPPTRRPVQRTTLRVHRGVLTAGTTTIAGCPTVTLEGALLPLAAVLTHEALVCLLDAALHRHLLDRTQLTLVVERGTGRQHSAALRLAASVADPRAESPAETLARLLLLPVIPSLEPQVELFDDVARLVARFDLGDRHVRFAVEADGKRGHAGSTMVARDRRRDRSTGRWGWATERVTWFELRRQQAALVQRVLEERQRHVQGRRPAA